MRPVLIHFFGIPIHTYGTMLAIAMFACYFLARQTFKQAGLKLNSTQIMDMCVLCVISGVLGSRVLYILQNMGSFTSFFDLFKVWEGGLSFHGGLMGGTIAMVIFLKKKKIPVLRAGDAIIPCVLIGLSWGRIGCFMNGCCFGRVTTVPWSVKFPEGSPAFYKHQNLGLLVEGATTSLAVHPAQFYATVMAVLSVTILLWLHGKQKFEGAVLAGAALLYGLVRFVLEFFRDDDAALAAGLTQSQFLSLGIFAVGVVLLAVLSPKSKASP
ncbi:MAG: prolipoprotein diacylglyceryl transferase [Planctomycetota bacterium]|nr:prolipoprotein diacylglyceryl transferase [Planctomycetota bacterium]MDA1142807.1 prolipoprotein diacylglyceryl transferase [Planctomycetota bacterium]